MRTTSRWVPRAIWLVLTIALVVSARGLPWRDALAQMRTIAISWVVVAVALNLAILPLWAVEWRLLLPKSASVSWRRMFEIVTTTASVHHALPFFAGEITAAALLVTRGALTRSGAISVLAMDQLLVGVAKLFVFAGAALAAPIPLWLRAGLLSLVVAVVALAAILLPLAHRWAEASAWLRSRPGAVREALAKAADVGVHLDTVRDPMRASRVAVLAICKKALELGGIVAIQAAFGLEPSFAIGLVVLAALAVTTALPIAPASLGIYEATAFAAYRLSGVSAEAALGIAVVQHVCFLVPMIATGYVSITVAQLTQRSASSRS